MQDARVWRRPSILRHITLTVLYSYVYVYVCIVCVYTGRHWRHSAASRSVQQSQTTKGGFSIARYVRTTFWDRQQQQQASHWTLQIDYFSFSFSLFFLKRRAVWASHKLGQKKYDKQTKHRKDYFVALKLSFFLTFPAKKSIFCCSLFNSVGATSCFSGLGDEDRYAFFSTKDVVLVY